VIVMPSNNNGLRVGYLAGKYPGRLGHLYSPGGQRGPYGFMPYALDNGAFGGGDAWKPEPWVALLEWARLSGQAPRWVLVPDVVGSKSETLERWHEFAPIARQFGWPLAFAVQDGMNILDVPKGTSVVFVGGSTEWKWRTAPSWCKAFPRVHIGRVNTFRRLRMAESYGAESVDGTGWTRGDQSQWDGLVAFLEGNHPEQLSLDEVA
jgi:hypothetical protein